MAELASVARPASPVSAVSWAPTTLRLSCPGCGRSRQLRRAPEWPADLREIVALCPQCEGHGRDVALLMYADGRVVTERPAAGQ